MERQYRVLIIDDEPDILSLLSLHLKLNNYQVFQASNGKKGIEIAQMEKPDIVVLDVMMPEIDGFEVAKALKENPDTSPIPLIFLTARTQTEDKIKGLMVGADDYLIKPFDFEELQLRIKRCLKNYSKGDTSSEVKIFQTSSLEFQINKWISEEAEFDLIEIRLQVAQEEEADEAVRTFLLTISSILLEKESQTFFLGKVQDFVFLLCVKFDRIESFCKELIDNFKQASDVKADLKLLIYPKIHKKYSTGKDFLAKYKPL